MQVVYARYAVEDAVGGEARLGDLGQEGVGVGGALGGCRVGRELARREEEAGDCGDGVGLGIVSGVLVPIVLKSARNIP